MSFSTRRQRNTVKITGRDGLMKVPGAPFQGSLTVEVADDESKGAFSVTVPVSADSTDAAVLKALDGAAAQLDQLRAALDHEREKYAA